MSHLLDQDDELLAAPSRELTLSTGSILGIFFGLALLCALFFGFGYNVGHRSASAASLSAHVEPEAPAATPTGAASDTFSGFKPATPAPASKGTAGTPKPATEQTAGSVAPVATTVRRAEKTSATAIPARSPEEPASRASASPVDIARASIGSGASPAAGTPAGSFFVQVAAVSHPEDASLLMGALRTRGYAIAERTDPADKLIHLQIGPLPSKPAAEAVRQRLQADGYNAFIK